MTVIRKFTSLERKFCRKNISNAPSFFTGFIFLGAILLAFSLSACRQPEHQTEKRLKVLTTIAPLYSFTKNITGDLASVDCLLASGAGPHEYSFSPADVRKIKETQVLIKIGVNLENWLDRLLSSAGKEKLTVVDTSSGVEIINNDPHIWLSPRNAIVQVKNIRDALIKADPENSEIYRENAGNYIKRLEALDRNIREEAKKFRKKEFVAFHSAFLYFTRDYGLKQVAVIQEFPEKNPTPKHIADVINTIKTTGTRTIFSEPQISHKIVKAIARDLNLQVYSLDTLETGELSQQWYEDKMRINLAVLKKALNQVIP